MDDGLLTIHDRLLAERPEGVEHDEASCPLCALKADSATPNHPGGEVSDTFNQEQVDALMAEAVNKATASLTEKLAELEKAAQETEVGKAVAQATAQLEEKLSGMQRSLDDVEVRATAAETAKAETEKFWADAVSAHEEASARESRKAERTDQAKKAGVLTDEYIESNADRFADMDEADFAARIDEWRVVAEAARKTPEGKPSGFAASREVASNNDNNGSALGVLTKMREAKFDPRTL